MGRRGTRGLVVGSIVLMLLAGCGGDDDSDKPAAIDPGPDVAYADLDFVPGVSTYDRETVDTSIGVTTYAAYASTADDARVTIRADDYVNDLAPETVPGYVPGYWKDGSHLESFPNGWTCGSLANGPRCYRPLTDGMLTVDCATGECDLDRTQLSDLSAMFYEAFSGGSTSGGATAARAPCAGVDIAAVNQALRPALGRGKATLSTGESETGDFYTCYVNLPPTALGAGGGQLVFLRHSYSSDTDGGSDRCTFGGTDAEAVYSSAVECLEQEDEASESSQGVVSTPAEDGPGGTVVSGQEVVQAEEGDYWWEVLLAGDTFEGADFDALTDLAGTLPAH
jgi:hypothetical protein